MKFKLKHKLRDSDWEVDYYMESVPMSTYLVAFIVCDFKSISSYTQKGVFVEVAARPQAIEHGDAEYALSEACKMMDYFVDYYNVTYPLKKSSKACSNVNIQLSRRVFKFFSFKLKLQFLILAKEVFCSI